MKQIYLITMISLLLCSCSSDNDVTTTDQDTTNPVIESISESNVKEGDILTITGKNFDPNETYTVTFNGVAGTITEVNVAYIKVEIPENATSGKIQLVYNGKTIEVGDIEISVPISKLYAYKRGSSQSIVEINTNDGTEISTIATLGDNYYSDLVFNKMTNEIVGKYTLGGITPENGSDISLEVFFYKINTTTGVITEAEISTDYEDFVMNAEGKLYTYKRGNPQHIVEVNADDGTEVSTIATLEDNFQYYDNFVFNESTNEIIAKYITPGVIDPDTGVETPTQKYLYRIKVETGEITELEMTSDYEDFIITQDGTLYAYKRGASQSIVEINTNDGTEVSTIITLDDKYYSDLVYNEVTNEIIGKYREGGVITPVPGNNSKTALTAFLYKINVETGVATEFELASDYESLIILNK
ncbi:IPT/TIG domain-containing protein [Aquimarina sp. I32.4]|uniref:IPT/TIG domain-containing protein n=1 Tax=Aquimarina sp. I32.4 TaxID=2053903 RepID=UPI000CDEBCBF|nr:IPT/TIG domain-containing protein [Aquimarina sp. I32.4]